MSVKQIKREQPRFPIAKIKKIIQENQEIGKLSNLIPPLMEKSLQIFLTELLTKTCAIAKEHDWQKLTPSVLKKALNELDHYDFVKDALDDVEDMFAVERKKPRAQKSAPKRAQPESQQKEKSKRGKKKVKLNEEINIQEEGQ